MKTVITAKLKLKTTPAQFQAVRATQLAYRDGLNYVSRYAFAHNKMSNKVNQYDILSLFFLADGLLRNR